MLGSIVGDHSGSNFARAKGILVINSAYLFPFVIAEYWQVNGTGEMIFSKLTWCTHINNLSEFTKIVGECDGLDMFHDETNVPVIGANIIQLELRQVCCRKQVF